MAADESAGAHNRFDGLAVEHVLGSLPEDKGREFRAHLMDCEHCRARVGELRALAHELADVEREETRQRAARQLETKNRDAEAPASTESNRTLGRHGGRAGVVVLLVAVIGLGAWNFFLRGEVVQLRANIEALEQSDEVLDNGREWALEDAGQGLEAEVREDGGALVVVVDNLADGSYRLQLHDAEGMESERRDVRPNDGRLFVLLQDVDAEVRELRLVPEGAGDDEPVLRSAPID